MIGKHCHEQLVRISDNKHYFRKRCVVCGRVFKQHKRKARVLT